MSFSISTKPRDTIFCEGNEKELYPTSMGRRRPQNAIFKSQGFDPITRSDNQKNLDPPVQSRPEIQEARNLYSGNIIGVPAQGRGKGTWHKDLLQQSTAVSAHRINVSKKHYEPKDCIQAQQSLTTDARTIRQPSPMRSKRVESYMDSNGMKDLLTVKHSSYYKGLFPDRR